MQSSDPPSLLQKATRFVVFCTNLLLILFGVLVLICITLAYAVPISFNLLYSIQRLINAHAFMTFVGILSLSIIFLGSIGLRFLKIDSNLFLGLQVFALIFLLVLEAALFYATLSHWRIDLEIGVIFAVQLFQPSTSEWPTMAGIQVALQCCGRGSFKDYYIANEAIVRGYVPHSCCDTARFNSSFCRQVAGLPTKKTVTPVPPTAPDSNRHAWLVPSQYSFPVGCHQRIRSVLVPTAIATLSTLAGAILLAVCMESLYLNITHEDDEETDAERSAKQSRALNFSSSDNLLSVPRASHS